MKRDWRDWDQRLLFAPLHTLPDRSRALAVVIATLVMAVWARVLHGNLHDAWDLPDVAFYLDMARWRYDLVPAPFSARPLAPLLAHWIAVACHGSTKTGFVAIAQVSLLGSLAATLWLLMRSSAPRWVFLAVATVPFWPYLLVLAGVPDPLYTLLLAMLLLALEYERMMLAAVLMLPLMLTRESTWLTLACLLLVAGRRLRWSGSAVAVACACVGSVLVRRLSVGSLPNPEHMTGAAYMVAKVASNAVRSLGLLPWSNVYPMMCTTPAWQHALHFGKVTEVGVCRWDSRVPLVSVGTLLTLFGALPVLLVALAASGRWRGRAWPLLLRFCLLYGTVSLLLAPTLGTWYLRLFGYAWPLPLVALPRLLDAGGAAAMPARRGIFGAFVVLHTVVCVVGAVFLPPIFLWLALGLEAAWLVLYFALRSGSGAGHAAPGSAGPGVVKLG